MSEKRVGAFSLKQEDVALITSWFNDALVSAGADTAAASQAAASLNAALVNDLKIDAIEVGIISSDLAKSTGKAAKESDVIATGAMLATQSARIDVPAVTMSKPTSMSANDLSTNNIISPIIATSLPDDEEEVVSTEDAVFVRVKNQMTQIMQYTEFVNMKFQELSMITEFMNQIGSDDTPTINGMRFRSLMDGGN